MTKIVTAPRKLSQRQLLVRAAEIKIQRIYALGDTLTLRQRSTIVRSVIERVLRDFDRMPTKEHGGYDAAPST